MSPLTYWNLSSSSKILVLQWLLGFMLGFHSKSEMIYLPKKTCLIIIHRNTTHILDILCIYSILCMLIYFMYVDILFSPTKTISIMFERVTTHCQTLKTWIGHNTMRYQNFNMLPHALAYIFSQFSIVWGYLERLTMRYRQVYIKNVY